MLTNYCDYDIEYLTLFLDRQNENSHLKTHTYKIAIL